MRSDRICSTLSAWTWCRLGCRPLFSAFRMRVGRAGPHSAERPCWCRRASTPNPEPNGDILAYPCGDKTVPPCARMPHGGFYFDALTRQDPIDDDHLCVEDNLEEFRPISDADLAYLKTESERLEATGKAILASFGGTSFGDIALVPGMELKHPKGIRAVDEWYVSTSLRSDYVYEVFERQCEIALRNLEKIHAVVGERVTVVYVTGTDFGAQQGPFISPKTYRTLFKPFHVKVNDWIHTHTTWKTFIHSCGSIWRLLDDIVDAGFDCLNPVQTSAADMDPEALKAKYGSRVTFWGGGIDTQKVLPFGTPEEVREMVRQRMGLFGSEEALSSTRSTMCRRAYPQRICWRSTRR